MRVSGSLGIPRDGRGAGPPTERVKLALEWGRVNGMLGFSVKLSYASLCCTGPLTGRVRRGQTRADDGSK